MADTLGETADRGAHHDAERGRVASVDLVRGLVMVLMVIDHVRDYFMNARINPTDLAATTPGLFFTRWITHFCAPTFMLLAGVSAALAATRRTRGATSLHLLKRGLWLIVLGQVWENTFVFFTYPHVVLALVLWAIGWSMVILSGLVFLPRAAIAAIGLTMIAGHNLLDGIVVEGGGLSATLWAILHQRGFRLLPGGIPILIGYPLIPWSGVMAAGYALGPVFLLSTQRRRPILLGLGLGSLALFVALRSVNAYGDPTPWSVQATPLFTVMSFLNCLKYPPSLQFLLMTLGPALLALAALDRVALRPGHPLLVIGRTPLFYYLMQWPIAHGLAVLVAAVRGEPIAWLFRFPPFDSPPSYGYSLGVVYFVWAITVALLYVLCRWYENVQRRRREAPGLRA